MNQEPTQSTPQDPFTTPQIATNPPAFAAPTQAPVAPKKRSLLGLWALILNLAYYGLPLLLVGVYLLAYATGGIDTNDMGQGILIFLAVLAFLGFVSLVGVAMIVLDILYLVKAKPKGKARVWVIISLVAYGLAWVAIAAFNVFQSLS